GLQTARAGAQSHSQTLRLASRRLADAVHGDIDPQWLVAPSRRGPAAAMPLMPPPPALGNSGAKLDTGIGVVVPLLLQFVEIAVPHLVRVARVPGVHAVIVGTQIADLVARRGVPGVEQRIG